MTAMTAGEWALLFGLLCNALAVWLGMRRIGLDVHKVEVATNSMKDALVQATRDAALGEGEDKGRADLKLEQAADMAAKSKKSRP